MRLLIILILLTAIIGCSENERSPDVIISPQDSTKLPEELAIEACVKLCIDSDQDLSDGPCLSNEVIEDWVCDVAHNPRQEIDNKKENQCKEYAKSASHFVELDSDCKLIRYI